MEPRREEPKAPKPRTEEKPKRFRIVKLEERIAPSSHKTDRCVATAACGTLTSAACKHNQSCIS
jgi:hypothetical protein